MRQVFQLKLTWWGWETIEVGDERSGPNGYHGDGR